MYKQYLKTTFKIIIFLISLIIIINLFVDPGKIYLKKIVTEKKANDYIKELLNSKDGLVRDGWNERLIKTTLAKETGNFECAILGSSHIMQISSIRKIGNIQNQCSNLLNLGVSGGSLEDVFVFSYFIFKNNKLPKKVFIDIAPWTLKFNMDSRYGAYMNEYIKMNELLEIKYKSETISYKEKVFKNLINWEYFYYSMQTLKDKKAKAFDYFKKKIIEPEKPYKYSEGYEKSIILPDGAHIYNSSYITKQLKNNSNIPIGGGDYKINGEEYSELAVNNLIKLLKLYQSSSVKVSFILTPYHPNVFKNGKTKSVQYMEVVNKVITEIAQKYNIKIYGSFFPEELGCKESEYLDFMHPTTECLRKIDFRY